MVFRDDKDPMERLFQKKAEEYDISYQEEDWLKLEKELDQRDRLIANRRKRWFIAAAVLLLFSLFGYAIYQNSQEIDRLHKQLQEQKLAQKPQNNRSGTFQSTEPNADRNTENKTTLSQSSSSKDTQRSDNRSTSDANTITETAEAPSITSTDFIVASNSVQKVDADALPCSSCRLGNLIEQFQSVSTRDLYQSRANPSSPYLAAISRQEKQSSPTLTNRDIRSPRTNSNASIGILAGPDLSTAGSLSDFHSPGYSIGLSMAYRLSPTLSIQAGFIRSHTRYVAGSGDYHPPESFWSYGMVADQTIAECTLIDIPISIKYDWAHFDRSRLFATAGISSYIMLKENYDFKYDSRNDELVKGWYGETGTRHWSSNINLSIGYEFDVNARFSLRAEPFLKLPIREVGWGKVKLYSLGSFISFNYNLY